MLLKILAACGATAPGPVPPPGTSMAGGNRSEMPYTYNIVTSANNIIETSIHVQSPSFATLRNPVCSFSNWYAQANGGEASSILNPFNLRAALEYPLGTRYRYYFPAAAVTQLMNRGDDWECQLDPLMSNIDIPPNSSYWIRIWQQYLNSDGSPYTGPSFNSLQNQLLAPGRNECRGGGSDPAVDHTVVGDMTAVASVTQSYGPTMIRALVVP